MRLGIEFFDEICLPVEIPVRFASNEDTPFVILFDVRLSIEIAVNIDFGELAPIIVVAPNVRPAVAVLVSFAHASSRVPDLDCRDSHRGHDTQHGHEAGGQMLH